MVYNTVARAEKIMNDYLEVIGASEPASAVTEKVCAWYENTDITDPYMLASLAMKFGTEIKVISCELIYDITLEYFPELRYIASYIDGEDISCGEIEDSLRDEVWR